jgi:NAD(P)-dependent dehydrogenase (short-subunit alcohol dehydrogenase family)
MTFGNGDHIPQVLVIGGTTNGIGRAFADIVEDGLDLMQCYCPTPKELDVRWPEGIRNWLHKTGRQMDHVLYCAGVKSLSWIKDLDPAEVDNTFDVNVFGFIKIVKELANWQTTGRICAISSDAALHPMRTSVDYCASKAALNMAIKVAAKELPNWHITGVMPGVVDTDMTRKDVIDISNLRGWSRENVKTELGDMLPPSDVADLAYWLLFRAPESMSGSIVEIRGR